MLVRLVLFVLCLCSSAKMQSDEGRIPLNGIDEASTLSCHRSSYNYKVTQVDKDGKACWDVVSVVGCWGRCDSNEIADFRFPFKKSTHPVCVHHGRNKAFVILRNCDIDASPSAARYEYYEAADCKCQQCSSLDTSCEGLRYRAHRSGPGNGFRRIIRTDDEFF